MSQKSQPGRFIAVYGPSGSGKSTVARELGRRLALPVIELDAVYHGPNWQDLEPEEFRRRVSDLLASHPGGWVFDGNYSTVRDLILARADTVVWLRLPFRVVYPRLVSRTLRRMVRREQLWNGNREEWRMAFLSRESILLWGITNWRQGLRKTARDLQALPHTANVIVLRRPGEVQRWLSRCAVPGYQSVSTE
ncbi:MAG: (d)CMP kinase [Dehalococcoidia bacterium]|nr:(d)CMP kinase [Dehalococcoidia bacterium]